MTCMMKYGDLARSLARRLRPTRISPRICPPFNPATWSRSRLATDRCRSERTQVANSANVVHETGHAAMMRDGESSFEQVSSFLVDGVVLPFPPNPAGVLMDLHARNHPRLRETGFGCNLHMYSSWRTWWTWWTCTIRLTSRTRWSRPSQLASTYFKIDTVEEEAQDLSKPSSTIGLASRPIAVFDWIGYRGTSQTVFPDPLHRLYPRWWGHSRGFDSLFPRVRPALQAKLLASLRLSDDARPTSRLSSAAIPLLFLCFHLVRSVLERTSSHQSHWDISSHDTVHRRLKIPRNIAYSPRATSGAPDYVITMADLQAVTGGTGE